MEKSQTGTVTGGSKLEKLWRKAHDNSYSDFRGMNQIEPKRTFINPNLSVKL